MADKIVQTTAQIINASKVIYNTKVTQVKIPVIVTSATSPTLLTTSVDNLRLIGNVTNMGEESIPSPDLFKRLTDYYNALDKLTLAYNKQFANTSSVSDLFTKTITFRRLITEAQTTSDQKFLTVNKALVETSSLVDVTVKRSTKQLTEIKNSIDQFKLLLNKQATELSTSSDQKTLRLNKLLTETKTASSLFSRTVAFNKLFLDSVDATDDFFGVANADDDQIASVGKRLVDYTSNSDSLNKRYFKALLDTENVLELLNLQFKKASAELINTTDQKRFRVAKSFSETDTVVDFKALSIGKRVTDTNNTSELLNSLINKIKTETITSSELISFLKAIGRLFQETIVNTDSGFVNNQNYTVSSYASAGYVGNNINFS